MKYLPLLAAILVAGSAQAQNNDPLGRDALTSAAPRAGISSPVYFVGRDTDTPTTQRQKRQWAEALRQQVGQWLVEDGGTLTAEHRYYVQRRVQKIRS
ncbi:MAG: hypothetical protein PGN08_05665 [Sphingomonas taxi]